MAQGCPPLSGIAPNQRHPFALLISEPACLTAQLPQLTSRGNLAYMQGQRRGRRGDSRPQDAARDDGARQSALLPADARQRGGRHGRLRPAPGQRQEDSRLLHLEGPRFALPSFPRRRRFPGHHPHRAPRQPADGTCIDFQSALHGSVDERL